ncbi:hypothetical protein PR202_ga24815 [Eleusine coracana subsp. coracana]|uniref:RING-type E3 ubiquitin transferase n=1 Tax=Eleusine coracana subsp. coracana TaxID=191504 RepID=A0AAV5D9V5_ELECO|nr:hypothetical protein PR202_ga24815 [Eleusine coracana subsp. coracana]
MLIDEHWRKEREDEEYYDNISRRLVPAAKKAIAGLYKPSWGETREEHGCAICLQDLQIRQKFRMIPCCYHSFHEPCIFEWLVINRVCPICQSPLPSEEEQRQLDDRDGETDELIIVD